MERMNEQQIIAGLDEGLKNGNIFVYYQPKMNHSTGRMVGAEALIRWNHPQYGMQYPSDFIPIFESTGLITKVDLFVFESVCRFQRKMIDAGIQPVPVSFNVSRHDIVAVDFPAEMEKIRKNYDVPTKLIHAEITESSAVGGTDLVLKTLNELHEFGYKVEMDDFGSGYSSLNILKDLDVDIIKLDMRFMSGSIGGRGGTIISSIVNMARWLDTPVIAEGVETVEQADFMVSIGCNYIQGYLYSKPIPEADFIEKLKITDHEPMAKAIDLIDSLDAGKFWDPKSMETLIFSNFVGGASIFVYENGRLEILRVNAKYMKELGMNMTETDIITGNPWDNFGEDDRKVYEDAIKKAIESKDEESCISWRIFKSKCCGEDRICVKSSFRVIGQSNDRYLFYEMIQNITAEKKKYDELYNSERKFRFASEQANVYAWEYTIATKEMRPCFRCMRDLGLPPLVVNYPEPAIEAGIFPQDYADMYRDWHKQLAEGVGTLEAIIPLTVGRVPFHVRYTTEFDENGRPLKAYGSATLVVDK